MKKAYLSLLTYFAFSSFLGLAQSQEGLPIEDFGRSVKWANYNLGANVSEEIGAMLNIASVDVMLGDAWRLPTREEGKKGARSHVVEKHA